ncbi:MAG: PA2169 family four-helix-bundle protein [Nitrososphaera sp.]
MDNQQVISTINELIETCRDGEMEFRICAQNVHDNEIKSMLTELAQHCAESATELQNEVRRLGGDPDTHGSVSGTLYRGWLNVKSAITGKDEAAVLAECERGEDIAVRRYEDALAQDLPGEIRSVIERQYQGVLANHDVVRNLRDRARDHA